MAYYEGGNNAQQPPVYPQINASAQPASAQPTVQYVNQYGQPIQAPSSGDGMPQQPAVQYVNQYGQAIAQPVVQQPAVQYVNQYGQPISAPQVQPQPQPRVVQAAPVQPAQPKTGYYWEMEVNERKKRVCSAMAAFFAALAIMISLATDQLATGDYYENDTSFYETFDIHCGFNNVIGEAFGYDFIRIDYDNYCSSPYNYDYACDADQAGNTCTAFLVMSMILAIIGLVWVQPKAQLPKCTRWTAMIIFIVGAAFDLIAIISWVSLGSNYCMNSEAICYPNSYQCFDLSVGSSIYSAIIGIICFIIAILTSKVTK